ncbi:MAG TPA: GNAT family N-acetyltransferase [Terriglobales bacterium]|nr:GNAT family N-acetyltransferase [Terriglobales bacterium]
MKLDGPDVVIRAATPADAAAWESMRRELWPDGAEDHGPEIAAFFGGQVFNDLCAVLVAESRSGDILGFAELLVRNDLPELEGKKTGYVEGLFVSPELRHQGIARKLLRASRDWARQQGCIAFASDRADRIVIDRGFGIDPRLAR